MSTNKWLLLVLLLATPASQAAKILVTWVNPTTRTDNSPLTDLAFIRIEWGTCNGSLFGTLQSSVTVNQLPTRATQTYIYPSGLTQVCVRGFALDVHRIESISSNVSVKTLLPTTGKPVTLGQPVIIEF
jgi:hypothetical protein